MNNVSALYTLSFVDAHGTPERGPLKSRGEEIKAPMRTYRRGFTLIEVLVAIAIIAILFAMILAGLSRAIASSRSATCMSNIKQVALAMRMYADESSNQFPSAFKSLYPEYLSELKVLICPSTDDAAGAPAAVDSWSSYDYEPRSKIIAEKGNNHSRQRYVCTLSNMETRLTRD